MTRAALSSAWIRPRALDVLLGVYRKARSAEPCGLLLGKIARDAAQVEDVVPAENVHPTPERAFAVDPAVVASVQREARAREIECIGSWHGHLVGPPSPGERDRAALASAELVAGAPRLLVIAGRGSGSVPVVRAYARQRGRVREIPLGTARRD